MLDIYDLTVSYATAEGVHKALDGISLSIDRGESTGIVGESGSGKTTLGLSILKLLPSNALYDSGSVKFGDTELLSLPDRTLRRIRGKHISMVFQDPLASLDPLFTVGYQISEAVRAHTPGIKRPELEQLVLTMFEDVGLPEPAQTRHKYPHELSGGMRQRVMLAIALVHKPSLVIADEPTTALDVTIQAQILDLLKYEKKHYDLTLLLITHDLGVTEELVDRLIVMYGGVIVEQARTDEVFSRPHHPYTKALLMAIPELTDIASNSPQRLSAIPGSVRPHYDHYVGCRFYDRCAYRTKECLDRDPDLTEYTPGHTARCIHPLNVS